MASSTETVSPSSVSDGKTNSHPILVIVNMAGQKPLRVNVQSTDSVDSLKAAISEVRDISPASQKLIFKGKKLESGTLEQNKLQKKAAVLLVQIQEKEKEDKGEAIRCEGGCGFWGNTLTGNMCSQCYEKKKKTETSEPKEEEPQKMEVDTPPEEDKKEKEKEKEKEVEAPEPVVPEVVQENSTRCFKCSKRVGYTIIKCRCGHYFCGKHRYTDTHDCPFDYRGFKEKILRDDNKKVQADRVQDRLK